MAQQVDEDEQLYTNGKHTKTYELVTNNTELSSLQLSAEEAVAAVIQSNNDGARGADDGTRADGSADGTPAPDV